MEKIKPFAWANKCAKDGYLYGIEDGPDGEDTHAYAVEVGDEAVPLYDQSTIDALRAEVDAKQARIDALMFEYCPDDMTPEQMEEWVKHQKPEGDVP